MDRLISANSRKISNTRMAMNVPTAALERFQRMGIETSVTYLAVKTKVYRLIDSLVEQRNTQADVGESIRRWWTHIHPADRALARKHLLSIMSKSNATLNAIRSELDQLQNVEKLPDSRQVVSQSSNQDRRGLERLKASL